MSRDPTLKKQALTGWTGRASMTTTQQKEHRCVYLSSPLWLSGVFTEVVGRLIRSLPQFSTQKPNCCPKQVQRELCGFTLDQCECELLKLWLF